MIKRNNKEWVAAREADAKLAYAALMTCYPFTLEDLPNENWIEVDEFEGGYQISTYGRLKSLKHKKPIIIKPFLSQKGYLRVSLSKDNKPHQYFVHDLVAKAFVANPENKPEVNHEDGYKFNNYFENLTWVTPKENIAHAVRTGLQKTGENRANSKLTNAQVMHIRKIYKPRDKEFGAKALARKFNVSATTIRDIVHRKKYKNAD